MSLLPHLKIKYLVQAISTVLCTTIAQPVLAHEFWIAPENYSVAANVPLQIDLKNGQNFEGIRQPYFDRSSTRLDIVQGETLTPYAGRAGDLPAVTLTDAQEGLLVLAHETRKEYLVYDTFAEFQSFVEHKGLSHAISDHIARGLPQNGFEETYSRHAKALVSVGTGAGADRALGLAHEIVSLNNPYTTAAGSELQFQLMYQNQPRANAQIDLFERTPDGAVMQRLLHSDQDGKFAFSPTPGATYLLNSVALRAAAADDTAVWRSLWATLTFAVPLQ